LYAKYLKINYEVANEHIRNPSLLGEGGKKKNQATAISHSLDKGHDLFHPMFSWASDELPVKG
jgi:hypothetical protein